MRRMLEANIWANMEQMLGPMLVVWAAAYTMRQIAQHWKQTFGSSHSLHSNIGHPLKRNKKPTAARLPSNANVGSWPFVIRASATRCVEYFQCPTLEVFDASCSCGFTQPAISRHLFPRKRYASACWKGIDLQNMCVSVISW